MGGWYFSDRPSVVEWNICVDPTAAAIAFRHAPRRHTCVGIDVTHGLTLDWSSGAVAGAVCRLKAIKRQMFGRANFDLLRRRVLLST